MLDALKFVQGAVAKKDFLPAMTHFVIEDGFVRAFNGTMALCAPIQLDLNCKPKAEPFVKAISNCTDAVSLSLTPAGKLKIVSGKFKAYIDCVQEATMHAEPEGEIFEFDGPSFYKALETIAPVIGDDAMRSWCNGVLFKDQSAFATNNIIIVEYWMGVTFPKIVNVPRSAIREILRIGKPPIIGQMTETSITFYFEDERWIRSQLLETGWPSLDKLLNANSEPVEMPKELFDALDYLKPFVDKLGRIYVKDGVARTSSEPSEGASYDIPDFPYEGIYQLDNLKILETLATKVDFTKFPSPCQFYGERLRGAIVGMRM